MSASMLETRLTLVADAMRAFAEATTDHQLLVDTIVRRLAYATRGFCAIALPSADGHWLEPIASHDQNADALA